MKIGDIDVNNIVVSNFIKTKNNIKYLIGYLDVIRPLLFKLPKMRGYVKTFKQIFINLSILFGRHVQKL